MSNSHITNPWLGLTSYEFEDSYKFFGRSDESGQLSKAITNNHVTVIYGPSGAGKTSIIKAGIFPKLLQEFYMPVYIRLIHDSEVNYSTQILRSIRHAASFQGIDVEQTCDFNHAVNDDDALWIYLHTHTFWRKDNYPVTPLIVIDQFEEIFTLNQNTRKISDFFHFVDELYDNLPPANIKNIIESTESYIPFHDDAKYKLVLSLREDFLARLEDYSHDIPILRKNRLGLKLMNGQQAFEVITNPLPDLVDDMVALKIIRKISGYTKDISKNELSDVLVETSILSLFCSELFKKMVEQSMNIISDSLVDSVGDNIIEDYYTNTMGLVSIYASRYFEDNLLTKSGFRNTIALEDAIENGVDKRSIEVLQNMRLIKIEIINKTERIEFTHDILCKIAKDKRDLRKKNKEKNVGLSYFFDGLICYSFFLITFWCLWDTNSGAGKLIAIFPVSILLTHLTRTLIKVKDRKAIRLGLFSTLFNIATLPIIANNYNEFENFFKVVFNFDNNAAWIFLVLYILFFVVGHTLVALINLNKKYTFYNLFSWDDIYTLRFYKKYPDFVRIESNMLLPVIIFICSFIVGSYSSIWLSFIFIAPLCLFIFSKLCTLFNLTDIQEKHKWIFYILFSLSLFIMFGSQYIFLFKHVMLYGSLGITLALTLLYFLKYNSSDILLPKKAAIAAGIWFISFLVFPLIIIGSNIFL
jgi:Archaeal ATPase.